MHVGLLNFVRCIEKKIYNMYLTSDKEASVKIAGLCVVQAKNNFELQPVSHVTFDLDIQKIISFYS